VIHFDDISCDDIGKKMASDVVAADEVQEMTAEERIASMPPPPPKVGGGLYKSNPADP
jgi:hypothetical protein